MRDQQRPHSAADLGPADEAARLVPLGILAAAGPLPRDIAAISRRGGRRVHVVALAGICEDWVADHPHTWASLGQVGRILGAFRNAGCRELVIAGAMQRPDLTRLKLDLGFFRHLPTVLALTRGGDDSVLRRVVRFFEGQGFVVRGVADTAPELLAGSGPIGARAPAAQDASALNHARRIIEALGPFDVGQAAVATVHGVVAIEGTRGTDIMLRELGRDGCGAGLATGGVLVKLAKPGQEMRVDLPTIGTVTVARAKAAGLVGIAVGAGAAIVLDRDRVRAAADASGIFVVGIDGAGPGGGMAAAPDPTLTEVPLTVAARRAPTPSDRRDIALARRLLPVLRREGAGQCAVIAGEHVLVIAGALPIGPMIRPLGTRRQWGMRALRHQLGTLAIDLRARSAGDDPARILDIELFRAAQEAQLAGIVCLGGAIPEARRSDIISWANEAKLFLLTEAG